jgi:N-acetylglucosamine kinase-like BadF-type ATPase
MPIKKALIKEFLRAMDGTDLKTELKKEIRVKFPDGSELVLMIDYRKKGIGKLKLIRSG